MIPLAGLFAIFALIGLALVVLDFAAKLNDPTPSQYNSGMTGLGITIFVICGLISAAAFLGSFLPT